MAPDGAEMHCWAAGACLSPGARWWVIVPARSRRFAGGAQPLCAPGLDRPGPMRRSRPWNPLAGTRAV